jgi:WD40 repeat protein
MLATGTNDSDGTIFLWDPATSAQLREPLINRDTSNLPRSQQKTVLSVAFNADGTRLAAGREDGTIEVWDVVEGKPLGAPMLGHKGALRSLAFSPEPDQKLLASGGKEGRLILWDTESTLSIEPHLADIDKEEWYVSFRPDGQLLTFTRSKGDVVVWDVRVKTWQEKACGVANRPLTDHEWMRYVGGNDREPLCLDAINDDQSATATTE